MKKIRKTTGENEPSDPVKKINDEIAHALESCANTLSLNEFSRMTGVRIELLRRFISRKTRKTREETWNKIYPVLKPYLLGPEPASEPPPRIGPAYRRSHDLVAMFSDQKILLDELAVLPEATQQKVADELEAAAGKSEPTTCESLSPLENRAMGAFLALAPEARNSQLLRLTELATAEVRKRRKELF